MADVNVYGTLKTMAGDGKVAVASQIWDESKGKFQSQINQKAESSLQDITRQQFDEIFD